MINKSKALLFIMLIVLIIPFHTFAGDMAYQHELKLDDMSFEWSLEGDQIHVRLVAATTGWVAVGFDPEDAMQGADIIIGAVKNGKVRIEDHYADRKRGHKSDKALGGSNNVLNPKGSESDGITTISFSLNLKADDKYDKAIQPSGMNRIMLAYGQGRDSFNTRHPFRTIYDIDLSTGAAKKIK